RRFYLDDFFFFRRFFFLGFWFFYHYRRRWWWWCRLFFLNSRFLFIFFEKNFLLIFLLFGVCLRTFGKVYLVALHFSRLITLEFHLQRPIHFFGELGRRLEIVFRKSFPDQKVNQCVLANVEFLGCG